MNPLNSVTVVAVVYLALGFTGAILVVTTMCCRLNSRKVRTSEIQVVHSLCVNPLASLFCILIGSSNYAILDGDWPNMIMLRFNACEPQPL